MPESIYTFFSLIEGSDDPSDESLRTFKWGFIDDGIDDDEDEQEDEMEDDEEDSSC